ncbi:MAG: D-alanyl-D-alanine endopeptidase [Rhizobacter sp.]
MTTLSRLFLALLVSVPVLLCSTPAAFAATGQAADKTSRPTLKKVRMTASSSGTLPRKALASPRVTIRSATTAQRSSVVRRTAAITKASPSKLSMGELTGLRSTADELDLKSSVALVMDQDTNEVLFSKNSQAVLPIASITKLMTAVVVTDAGLPLDEALTISQDDVDTEKGSRSRLTVGTRLTREEMLHLALMSSENRAAHALGRNYPGGLTAFVAAMNQKAHFLGMTDTHYVEPTGLSSLNQSSAHDLATLVKLAHTHPLIRELSTSPEFLVDVGHRQLQFRNTNGLVRNPTWDIGLQKTGYISEAGRCLVMQASLAGRKLIMVFLDSTGRNTRLADAERVRRWITEVMPKVAS